MQIVDKNIIKSLYLVRKQLKKNLSRVKEVFGTLGPTGSTKLDRDRTALDHIIGCTGGEGGIIEAAAGSMM